MKNRRSNIKIVTFQCGVNLIGEPIFRSHVIENTSNRFGKKLINVKEVDYRL
jgi:hypothetical protein